MVISYDCSIYSAKIPDELNCDSFLFSQALWILKIWYLKRQSKLVCGRGIFTVGSELTWAVFVGRWFGWDGRPAAVTVMGWLNWSRFNKNKHLSCSQRTRKCWRNRLSYDFVEFASWYDSLICLWMTSLGAVLWVETARRWWLFPIESVFLRNRTRPATLKKK